MHAAESIEQAALYYTNPSVVSLKFVRRIG
jgi:hypothetical protein